MNVLQPWQLLLVTLAGWINRQQQDVIAYIEKENRTLKSKLKGKRIRFTDDERRRLAVKSRARGCDEANVDSIGLVVRKLNPMLGREVVECQQRTWQSR